MSQHTYNLSWGKNLYPISTDYFCFTPMKPNAKMAWVINTYETETCNLTINLQYSFDKENWTNYTPVIWDKDYEHAPTPTYITLTGPVYWRGTNTQLVKYNNAGNGSMDYLHITGDSSSLMVSGNLSSLLNNTPDTAVILNSITEASQVYDEICGGTIIASIFTGSSEIVDCSNMSFNVTYIPSYGLKNFFYGCYNLTKAPKLPYTTIFASCYSNMFTGCVKLKMIPELPARNIPEAAYNDIFYGCNNIIFSDTQSDSTPNVYRIPKTGNNTSEYTYAIVNSDVSPNITLYYDTTYYTNAEVN